VVLQVFPNGSKPLIYVESFKKMYGNPVTNAAILRRK